MNQKRNLDLIKAICTRVQDLEGYVNKTKLIKLLYLIDIEYYRIHKKTFTGFNWIFYDHGPWAYEYNDIYECLLSSPDFKISDKKVPQKISYINCISGEKDFSDIFEKPGESLFFRGIIEKWALEDLNKILNYAYFNTEPMDGAMRHKKLDFSKIDKLEKIPKFRLQKSPLPSNTIKKLRMEFKEKLQKEKKSIALGEVIKPRFDDLYWQEIEKMDADSEY